MLLQGYILNQGDGWSWTLDYVARAIDDALPAEDSDTETDDFDEAMRGFATMATTLGRRLGELHAVLAMPCEDAGFTPREADDSDAGAWTHSALEELQRALDMLAARGGEFPTGSAALAESFRADVEEVLAVRDQLPALAKRLAAAAPGTLCTRIHGDLHLGQVLIAQNETYIIDFEGEPGLPLEYRRRKTSPLRDVAGVLRSFDYAAATVGTGRHERTHAAVPPARTGRRDALLERFRLAATAAFLGGYHEVAAQAEHRWASPEQARCLLDLFLLERAAYEVCYEANNRVAWLDLPVRGLARLLRTLLSDPTAHAVPAGTAVPPVDADPSAPPGAHGPHSARGDAGEPR
jgi:maltose alpha-D-glucosyltransferase/alpha-amylase